jgi:hypothetical protein
LDTGLVKKQLLRPVDADTDVLLAHNPSRPQELEELAFILKRQRLAIGAEPLVFLAGL